MADPLAKEKVFLKSNQKILVEEFPGKYLLIKGETVHGAFETYDEGIAAGASEFGPGPFLVRSVIQPDDAGPPEFQPCLSECRSLPTLSSRFEAKQRNEKGQPVSLPSDKGVRSRIIQA